MTPATRAFIAASRDMLPRAIAALEKATRSLETAASKEKRGYKSCPGCKKTPEGVPCSDCGSTLIETLIEVPGPLTEALREIDEILEAP